MRSVCLSREWEGDWGKIESDQGSSAHLKILVIAGGMQRATNLEMRGSLASFKGLSLGHCC